MVDIKGAKLEVEKIKKETEQIFRQPPYDVETAVNRYLHSVRTTANDPKKTVNYFYADETSTKPKTFSLVNENVYNGQAITEYNWIDTNGTFNEKYGFNDPALLSPMSLGETGIHVTTDPGAALLFARALQNKLVLFDDTNLYPKHIMLLYTFKCPQCKKQHSYDSDPNIKTNIATPIIMKFTDKTYDREKRTSPYLKPVKMTLCYDLQAEEKLPSTMELDGIVDEGTLKRLNNDILGFKPATIKSGCQMIAYSLEWMERNSPRAPKMTLNEYIAEQARRKHAYDETKMDWSKIYPLCTTDCEGPKIYLAYDICYPNETVGGGYHYKYMKYKFLYRKLKRS